MFFQFAELKKKFFDVVYDVSIGLLKDYKKSTIDLARLEAANFYLRFVKVVRREFLTSILIIFGLILFANVIAVLQMALLLYAPWGTASRMVLALVLGLGSFTLPLIIVLRFFSEKRWMEITKADELMEKVMGKNGA